mgnify:CR=1 FL=1
MAEKAREDLGRHGNPQNLAWHRSKMEGRGEATTTLGMSGDLGVRSYELAPVYPLTEENTIRQPWWVDAPTRPAEGRTASKIISNAEMDDALLRASMDPVPLAPVTGSPTETPPWEK